MESSEYDTGTLPEPQLAGWPLQGRFWLESDNSIAGSSFFISCRLHSNQLLRVSRINFARRDCPTKLRNVLDFTGFNQTKTYVAGAP
jgi:hypothetical protein